MWVVAGGFTAEGYKAATRSEPVDAGAGPGKSSLFFLTSRWYQGIRLSGDMVLILGHSTPLRVSGALATALENTGERLFTSRSVVPITAAGLQGE
jgi:hypothetical protein